jgi:hypothetical protein
MPRRAPLLLLLKLPGVLVLPRLIYFLTHETTSHHYAPRGAVLSLFGRLGWLGRRSAFCGRLWYLIAASVVLAVLRAYPCACVCASHGSGCARLFSRPIVR